MPCQRIEAGRANLFQQATQITSYLKCDRVSRTHTHTQKKQATKLKVASPWSSEVWKFDWSLKKKKKSCNADTLRNNHSDSTEFKVASHPCVLGTTKAVLGMNRLQGLRKLKVSACWQNVMLHRRISDKPGVRFSSAAPVISMEMSWGVVAPLSPPTTPVPCQCWWLYLC